MILTEPNYTIIAFLLDTIPTRVHRSIALGNLAFKLTSATIVQPEAIPEDIITMHSVFQIREYSTGTRYTFSLVFPGEANPEERRLSITSLLGATVIGHSVGDVVACKDGSRIIQVAIECLLFQPESETWM